MVKVKTISDFPEGSGEDRTFISDGLYGIIDGSSPIEKVKVKVNNYSEQVVEAEEYTTKSEWFAERLAQNVLFYEGSVPERFKRAVKSLSNPTVSEELLLSASVAGVSLEGDYLKCYVLGGCVIVVETTQGFHQMLFDKRFQKFERLVSIAKEEAEFYGKDIKGAIQKQKIKNLEFMNTENGFWKVAFKGNFSKEFISSEFKLDSVKSCLILSEGFVNLFNPTLFTFKDIFSERMSLKEAVKKMREYEDSTVLGRVNIKEDISAMLLKF